MKVHNLSNKKNSINEIIIENDNDNEYSSLLPNNNEGILLLHYNSKILKLFHFSK